MEDADPAGRTAAPATARGSRCSRRSPPAKCSSPGRDPRRALHPPRPLAPRRPCPRSGRRGAGRHGAAAGTPRKKRKTLKDALVDLNRRLPRAREDRPGRHGLRVHRRAALPPPRCGVQGPQREVHLGQRLRGPVRERGALGRRAQPPRCRSTTSARRTAATTFRWSSSAAAPSRSAWRRRQLLNWMHRRGQRPDLRPEARHPRLMLAEDGERESSATWAWPRRRPTTTCSRPDPSGTPAFIARGDPAQEGHRRPQRPRQPRMHLLPDPDRGEPVPREDGELHPRGTPKAPVPRSLRAGARRRTRSRRRHLQADAEGA